MTDNEISPKTLKVNVTDEDGNILEQFKIVTGETRQTIKECAAMIREIIDDEIETIDL